MEKISLIDEDFMDFPIGGMTLYVTTDITDRVLHGALWSIMADIIWNR